MSLTSSLLIGQTALSASQVALQVTGNNIANAATPGYHRQRVELSPLRGQMYGSGTFLGRGVGIADIQRMVDPALLARLRGSISDERAALTEQSVLARIESLTNELTGIDLSSELSEFFNRFSELANTPDASVVRSTVVEQGAALAGYIRSLRQDLVAARTEIDGQLSFNISRADSLCGEIARLNEAITTSELGQGEAGALRDQRDALINELAQLVDITVIEQDTGGVDILVDSVPIVLGVDSRGLELETESTSNGLEVNVLVSSTQEELRISSGTIGSLLAQREAAVTQMIDDVDALASALIFEVNRLHSIGRPPGLLTDTTGWLRVPLADQVLAMNDPANETFAELPFAPRNGSFSVRITDSEGNTTTTTIMVDLDGIDSTGVPGYGDDTTMEDIRAALDAIPNLTATITASGELRLTTAAGYDVSFESDSSGVLAVLGINTYFQGTDALDIEVREELAENPQLICIGLGEGTNETALAIAGLRDATSDLLNGDTLQGAWLRTTERVAVQASSANTRAQALGTVRASLEAQEAAISGVSLDEESINLLTYQQQYTGAARFISLVNDLTRVLLDLV